MTKFVNMHAAKTHLSRLAEEVVAGEDIVISKAGKPLLRLVAYQADATVPEFGFLKGQIDDLSVDEWHQLDVEFNELFADKNLGA